MVRIQRRLATVVCCALLFVHETFLIDQLFLLIRCYAQGAESHWNRRVLSCWRVRCTGYRVKSRFKQDVCQAKARNAA